MIASTSTPVTPGGAGQLSTAAAPVAPTPAPGRRFDRTIVDGPLARAVWKLAWPTMLTNIIGGLQGIVDNIMVGHLVGYNANAGIGVAFGLVMMLVVLLGVALIAVAARTHSIAAIGVAASQ